jgi:diguanylate cyclase (GGDEF)-like protein
MTALPASLDPRSTTSVQAQRAAHTTFSQATAAAATLSGPAWSVPAWVVAPQTLRRLTGMLTAGLVLELGWAIQSPLDVAATPLWAWLQAGLLACVLSLWTQTRRLTSPQGPDVEIRHSKSLGFRILGFGVLAATLAHSDDLTGLPGRRALNEQLQALLGSQDQSLLGRGPGKKVWSALLIGVDHLGTVNDTYGQGAGDTVLRAVILALRQELRGDDVLGRWSGEEFLALLPGTDFEGAMVAAERLRRAVALRTFAYAGTVTVSIGVASWLPGDTLDRVVARADAGMYLAQRAGRNRVAFKN